MLGGLAHPLFPAGDRPDLAREPDLAVHHQGAVHRAGAERRAHRGQDREVRAGLGDADSTDDVRVHVETLGGDPGMPVQDREQHVQPALVDPHRQPARRTGRLVHQRLELDQQRPGALAHHRHHAPRDVAGSPREEDRGRIADLPQPRFGHREQADLVRGPETVLDRPDDPEPPVRLALEIEHGIDHVLQHPRPRERPVLGDVPDQKHGDGVFLRVAREPRRALPHLRDAARGGLQHVGEHGLDRVDDHDPGRFAGEHVEDRLHARLREQLHPIRRHFKPLRA